MKLSDIRRMAIRQQVRVRFRLSSGDECVVNEYGIARVAGIRDVPQVNLEDEFSKAIEAQLETVAISKTGPRTVTRSELEKLASSKPTAPDDHDE